MTLGLPSGASKPRFGSPLYNITTTASANVNRGGTATISGTGNTQGFAGASSVGIRRNPSYSTIVGFDYAAPSPASMQSKAQETIANASRQLKSKDSILVEMDGETLVLRGSAASANERRLAEALVRMTPGIYDVRNELQVPEVAPAPRKIP
jgi:osmotically-inducible protein OsmY